VFVPFFTPIAIATGKPIVDLPTPAGVAHASLVNIIDPPTYEILESMITRLEAEYSGQGLPTPAPSGDQVDRNVSGRPTAGASR